MKRVHILVSGIVQGVSFRYFTKNVADKHDIKGWVRNLTDGRVEIVCEGERVKEFIDIIKRGPLGSRVDNLQIEETITEDIIYKSFEIRQTSNL